MSSVAILQATLSQQATQNLSGRKDDGASRLERASKERQEKKADIEQRQERAQELMKELEEAQDTSAWDDFCNFFTGGDNGVGEIGDQASTNQAEIERITNELKVLKAETSDILSDIKAANDAADKTYRACDEMLRGERKVIAESR